MTSQLSVFPKYSEICLLLGETLYSVILCAISDAGSSETKSQQTE